jgi:glutamine amidotransferase-like uncharacterized protein
MVSVKNAGSGLARKAGPAAAVGDSAPAAPALIALYDDSKHVDSRETVKVGGLEFRKNNGGNPAVVDQTERWLNSLGYRVERLTRESLNALPDLSRYQAMVMPGGFAFPGYTLCISEKAKALLRREVEHGLVVAAICAGEYALTDCVTYEGTTYGAESGYTMGLLPWRIWGPVGELAHYGEWRPTTIAINAHAAVGAPVESFEEGGGKPPVVIAPIWYAAGGVPIVPPHQALDASTNALSPAHAQVEIVATYAEPGTSAYGAPAVVTYRFGEGQVIGWGPHPEGNPFAASGTGFSEPTSETSKLFKSLLDSAIRRE